jgi:molybdopterin converting factor small subunit
MTKVRIPPTLRNEVGGERELLGEGDTVREVLQDVAARYPAFEAQLFEDGSLAPFVNVYVGGEDVRTLDGLETRVNGASVILLPAMAGGAPATALGSRRIRFLLTGPGFAERSRRWTALRRQGRAEHCPSLLRLPATRREPGRGEW